MNDFLKALKEEDSFTFTENLGGAYSTTNNWCLDAFGQLGAMKDSESSDILLTFNRALSEDKELAMRLLFYIRDIRGGQGMRRVFRIILRHLAFTHPELVTKNFDNILFFGRGDDYLCLVDTPVEEMMMEYCYGILVEDLRSVNNGGSCSLLAKWMPSENTSSAITRYYAKKFVKGLGISSKNYRKLLSKLRKEIDIVEEKMSQNKWEEIDFEKLPAKASMIYSDAFMRHTQENYVDYLHRLAEGSANINASSLFPVDIVHRVFSATKLKDRLICDAMWKNLPNYFDGKEETGLCVVDTSGSMSGLPLEVALSLGVYCADKAKGAFKNHFITFSEHPKLQEIKGDGICDKISNFDMTGWDMNTNIEKVFDLILTTAIKNGMSNADIPQKLYIISDMQFDSCVTCSSDDSEEHLYTGLWHDPSSKKASSTVINNIADKFKEEGYTMPSIVYWNVRNSNCGMFQMKGTDNCCMVSGYSPSLFKSVIEGTEFEEKTDAKTGEKYQKQKLDPVNIMRTTLFNERYDRVYTGKQETI